MKSFTISLFIIFTTLAGFSQNVGIGTTSPNSSAMLDVSSTTKGFLFPRMTYAQRIAIASPTAGLMVFQTNSGGLTLPSGIYFNDGSLWKRIARSDELGSGGGSTGWTVAADDQYSNLIGNVGIGTSSPTSKFHLVGNMLAEGGSITINNPTAILQLQSSAVNKGYFQLSGNNVRIGTNAGNTSGKFIVRMNGQEYLTIDTIGQVGIGVTVPKSNLQVDGPSIATYTDNGLIMLGGQFEPNIVISRTEILARNSGGPSQLFLQQDGGVVRIGGTGSTADNTKLHITDGSFANYSTYNGYIMLGQATGLNMAIGAYEILARDNGAAAPLYLQQDGGTVRMGNGSVATGTKLHITDGEEAGLATNGYLFIGETSSEGIAFDNNDIQSKDNGVATYLKVQQSTGPGMQIGYYNTATLPESKLYIPNGDDAGFASDGYIHLGLKTSTNLIFDNNEIMARNNGNSSTLYLQNDGGLLDIGSHTTILNTGGSGEVLKLDGVNPNIGFYQSGAYKSFLSQSGSELFMGNNAGRIHLDGTQVAIGTVNSLASAFKLTVSGKIICEEVKVELYADWPDYVFNDEYDLKPIHELKSFISTNNHLPNIPKASEVAENGFELGEMNQKLLEKVEELTLYIIQLQEQIDDLNDRMND